MAVELVLSMAQVELKMMVLVLGQEMVLVPGMKVLVLENLMKVLGH